MSSRWSKPTPVTSNEVAGYPSLIDHICKRRKFIKQLALGVVSYGLGGHVLSGCAESTRIQPENFSEVTTGGNAPEEEVNIAGSGPINSVEQTQKTYEEHMPLAGAAPETEYPEAYPYDATIVAPPKDAGTDTDTGLNPQDAAPLPNDAGPIIEKKTYEVRLPETQYRHLIIASGEELTYAVTFTTDDVDIAEFFKTNSDSVLTSIHPIIAEYSCATMNTEQMQAAIVEVLIDFYKQSTGIQQLTIQNPRLIIEYCQEMPLSGGMPEPDY